MELATRLACPRIICFMVFAEESQRLLFIDHFINVIKFNKENPTNTFSGNTKLYFIRKRAAPRH